MLKIPARLELILSLNEYALDLELLKNYQPEYLLKLCESLKNHNTPQHLYKGYYNIQKELIDDERFFFYLDKFSSVGMELKAINFFIKVIHSHGDTSLCYPINRLLSSMALAGEPSEVFYDYLKSFSSIPTDKAQKVAIIRNLCLYRESISKPVEELSDVEKRLFMEPCLTNNKLIPDDIDRVLVIFLQYPTVLDIIRFLYKKKLIVMLSSDIYKSFCTQSQQYLENLKALHKLLNTDNMALMMNRWQENNCTLHDLIVLRKKLVDMNEKQIEDALYSRSGYLNLIYGNSINNIPFSELPRYKEDVLIYAITNKKNAFLRLVEKNLVSFNHLGPTSILFKREFYANYFNLNSLNTKNLQDCRRMNSEHVLFESLEHDRIYSFEEIKLLCGQPRQYYKLYANLQIQRIDGRLIVLKQLIKQNLLASVTNDNDIDILAAAFSQKPLSSWREQDFAHIDRLKPQDAIDLLIQGGKIEHLVPQMRTRIDSCIITRNCNSAHNYETIAELKNDLLKIDNDWGYLVEKMEFTEVFLRKNEESVLDFLSKNGAEIVKTYYVGLNKESQHKAMKCIVKSELMGEFVKLKYFDDDLRKELDYPITHAIKATWMENTEAISSDGILVKECDDFYNTMMLGVLPQRTCLSYINGQYKECLLSSFDSNKKTLYAYIGDTTVGRAIIRLTKGKFSNSNAKKDDVSLTFVDLEAHKMSAEEKDNKSITEQLVLFLERSYSSGITDEVSKAIDKVYIDLMSKKAFEMGAMLVVSNSYKDVSQTDFNRTLFHLYISKSKAGEQYLDSLDGNAKVSDEGGYRSNIFYIHKAGIHKGGI